MKNILLCGIAILALSLTPSVNADTVLLDDEITTADYFDGATINGRNDWATSTGANGVVFGSGNDGYFSSQDFLSVDSTATRSLLTPGAVDTGLSALFFGRFRPSVGFKSLIALNDGTNDVLVLGANETANYVSGTGVTSYTEESNPFDASNHEYHRLRLAYDDGAGQLFSSEATNQDPNQTSFTFNTETLVASFIGNFDIQTLQSLSVTTSSTADRIGSVNVQSITVAVPEPAIAGLGLMYLAGLATRRRRS